MLGAVIKWFFLTLGVVFFLLILGGVYFYVADPYEVRPLISALMSNDTATSPSYTEEEGEASEAAESSNTRESANADEVPTQNNAPLVSETQQQALESVGIDVEALPSTITPEMKACFVAALGEVRTQEIAEGDSPTPAEVFRARHCIE